MNPELLLLQSQNNINLFLKIAKKIQKDFFVNAGYFPIGTKQIYSEYIDSSHVPEDDWIYFDLPKEIHEDSEQSRQVFSMAIINPPGFSKTTLMIRILSYFYQAGYLCIYIDPKGKDIPKMKKLGSLTFLHPKENPIKLPIVTLLPKYVENMSYDKELGTKLFDTSGFDVTFSHNLYEFTEKEDWLSFGLGDGATENVINSMNKINKQNRKYTIELLLRSAGLSAGSSISHSSKQSAERKLTFLLNSKFFDTESEIMDIRKYWNENKIPIIGYFEKEKEFITTSIGNIIKQVRRFYSLYNKPILIIIDDFAYAAGSDLDSSISSVKGSKTLLEMGRSANLNLLVGFQYLRQIHEGIVKMCTHLMIGGNIVDSYYLRNLGITLEDIERVRSHRPDPSIHDYPYFLFNPSRINPIMFKASLSARGGHTW